MRPKKRKLHELLNTEIVKPLVVLQRVYSRESDGNCCNCLLPGDIVRPVPPPPPSRPIIPSLPPLGLLRPPLSPPSVGPSEAYIDMRQLSMAHFCFL